MTAASLVFTPQTINRVRLGRHQVVRRFVPAEDEIIKHMFLAGHQTGEIADRLVAQFGVPRSQATVAMRLKTLVKMTGDERLRPAQKEIARGLSPPVRRERCSGPMFRPGTCPHCHGTRVFSGRKCPACHGER